MENKEEIWKDVPGYEGLYQVSSLGRIKSLSKLHPNSGRGYITKERVMRVNYNIWGYTSVQLYKDKSTKRLLVHRLVLCAFSNNPESKRTVNHKNGIRDDNKLSNLEWMTYGENHSHAYRELKRAHPKQMLGKTGFSHPKSKAVDQIDFSGKKIATYGSQQEAMRETGISNACISSCIRGWTKTAGGYTWRLNLDTDGQA